MTTKREQIPRGSRPTHRDGDRQGQLDRRRADMHAAEGHAGSIPGATRSPSARTSGSTAGSGSGCSVTDTASPRRSGLQ